VTSTVVSVANCNWRALMTTLSSSALSCTSDASSTEIT
jgi:hypothetical protein